MGICATWVESESLAIEMMQKREHSDVRPSRCECTMRLGNTYAELNYMFDEKGKVHEMWLLWFESIWEKRTHNFVSDARSEGYELMRLGKLSYRTR